MRLIGAGPAGLKHYGRSEEGGGVIQPGDVAFIETDPGPGWYPVQLSQNINFVAAGATPLTAAPAVLLSDRRAVLAMPSGTGPAYRSTDQGASWSSVPNQVGNVANAARGAASPHGTYLLTPSPGASGVYSLYRSVDAGLTWTSIPVSADPDRIGAPIWCNNAWVMIAASAAVYRSVDDGLTWSKVGTHPAWYQSNSLVFANSTEIYTIFSSASYFHRSTDLGATWTQLVLPQGATRMLDPVFCGGRIFYARVTAGSPTQYQILHARPADLVPGDLVTGGMGGFTALELTAEATNIFSAAGGIVYMRGTVGAGRSFDGLGVMQFPAGIGAPIKSVKTSDSVIFFTDTGKVARASLPGKARADAYRKEW